MGRLFVIDLEGLVYSCKYCQTHFAVTNDIISKSFHCKHGRAYLFDNVVNVTVGEKEHRVMITGWHTVADIFCVSCGSLVGWKYVQDSKLIHCKQLSLWWFDANSLFLPQEIAYDKSQKYKEGKFILERFKVLGPYGGGYDMNQNEPMTGSDDEE
jgi:hypothetical protein